MEWISENWIWLALGFGMVAMHMFGHGHGSRGSQHAGHAKAGHGGGCCGAASHDHGVRKPELENAAGSPPGGGAQ